MILDRLGNAHLYDLGERFRVGFDYLRQVDPVMKDGRYPVIGDDDVVAIAQSYTTKPRDQGRWEAHRRYADIQFIVAGVERMGVRLVGQKERPTSSYDVEKDVEFYDGDGDFFTVAAESFAVFFPHDVHMPGLMIDTPQFVKKVVIKVRLD